MWYCEIGRSQSACILYHVSDEIQFFCNNQRFILNCAIINLLSICCIYYLSDSYLG